MNEGALQDHIWTLLQPHSTAARKRIVGALQGRVLEQDMLVHQEDWLRQREAYLRELEDRYRPREDDIELC
jgi:hypothetical protein